MRAITTIAVLVLAGCASQPVSLAERHGDKCVEMGFTPETEAFGQCLLQMEDLRLQRRADRHNRYQTWKAITD